MFSQSRVKLLMLFVIALGGTVAMFFVPPIPQDVGYHSFADSRRILGITNFANIVSNIPFILVGLAGLRTCFPNLPGGGAKLLRTGYVVFFLGMILVGCGSAYYHYAPSNATLVWDRLPMTISFMAFFSLIIGESISVDLGRKLLLPLVVVGALSVGYWYVTELREVGDLRAYGLVQFLPLLLIPLILALFGSRFTNIGYLWAILASYTMAKLAEYFDAAILTITGFISGHSVKHLLAALGAFWVIVALKRRQEHATQSDAQFKQATSLLRS